MQRNIKIKWFGRMLLIISFLFIGVQLKDFKVDIKNYLSFYNIILCILAILLLMLSTFMCATGWRKIINVLIEKEIPSVFINKTYVKTNLGKYIPGNVMHFVGRGVLASKYNINAKRIGLSIFYELFVIAIIGMSTIFLTNQLKVLFDLVPIQFKTLVIVGILIIIIIVILWGIVNKKTIWQLGQKYILEAAKVVKKSAIYYLTAVVLMGISFIIIVKTLYNYNIGINELILCIGAFILAWFIGFIIPGAPGGLGIREVVLVLYIGIIIPSDFILEAVIIHRIISILADVLMYITYMFIGKEVDYKDMGK